MVILILWTTMVFRRNYFSTYAGNLVHEPFTGKTNFRHIRVLHVSFIINLLFIIRWVMTQKKKNDHQQKAYRYFAQKLVMFSYLNDIKVFSERFLSKGWSKRLSKKTIYKHIRWQWSQDFSSALIHFFYLQGNLM